MTDELPSSRWRIAPSDARTYPDAVFIMRPSKWGNPFIEGRDGNRSEVVAKYRNFIYTSPDLFAQARLELRGRHLLCGCQLNEECHGDILEQVANCRVPLSSRREYSKEAKQLELFLTLAGVLREDTNHLSLVQLMSRYCAAPPGIYPPPAMVGAALPITSFKGVPQRVPLAVETLSAYSQSPIVISAPPPPPPVRKLTSDQIAAWAKLTAWTRNSEPFFILRGYAGTGKTFLLQMLADTEHLIYLSAPTHKAAKVLGTMVGRRAKTTYSLLGLRMEQRDDKLVLTPGMAAPYFPRNSIIVIDEAGMAGTELFKAVRAVLKKCGVKILLVGDPCQLTPIGESRSPAWKATLAAENRALLREVVRYDDQLLTLATAVRDCIKNKNWDSPLCSDHDDTKGVWKWKSPEKFERSLLRWFENADNLSDTKVVAWRNTAVERYNKMIRQALGFTKPYSVGDLILLAAPIERDGSLIAHTDDEFRITDRESSVVTIDGKDVPVWSVEAKGDETYRLNIPKNQSDVDAVLAMKANAAKALQGYQRKVAWREFWEAKAKFNPVRYGFALTAHRIQGSTCRSVYVDQHDILCNSTKSEAFRALYVGVTRATQSVHSY